MDSRTKTPPGGGKLHLNLLFQRFYLPSFYCLRRWRLQVPRANAGIQALWANLS